jgi:hypothetical protein
MQGLSDDDIQKIEKDPLRALLDNRDRAMAAL